jgi:alpha-L-rhamnosidase
MLDNGADFTWEHWDGRRSRVHNCFNGIGSWFYQALAGITPDEQHPGYRHIVIRPQPVDGIDWVKASKNTPYGRLVVNWEKKDGRFVLDTEIPVGSVATVHLPDGRTMSLESGSYRLVADKIR